MANRAAIPTLIALVATGSVPSAQAAPVQVLHQSYSDSNTSVSSAICGFPIETRVVADIEDTLFFDTGGNLLRLLETVHNMRTTFSANGRTLESVGTGGFDVRFESGVPMSVTTFGIDFKMTLPGQGVVFLDVGRTEFALEPSPHVVFEAGPQRYDFAAFCAALAQ